MKVGIITMYYKNDNAGGLLQSYALQHIISKEGYDARQICFDATVSGTKKNIFVNATNNKGVLHLLYKAARYACIKVRKGIVYVCLMPKFETMVNGVSINMERFQKWILHTDCVYTAQTIDEVDEIFDIYVCGSDQVWGTQAESLDVYTLGFVKNGRKISYAPSIARSGLTDCEIKGLCKKIQSFDAVSLREDKYQKAIELELGREVPVVIDPTMLLNRTEWDEMFNTYPMTNEELEDSMFEEPYIFVYLLGGDPNNLERIERFAKQKRIELDGRLKIVYCPYTVVAKNNEIIHWKGRKFGDYRVEHFSPAVFVKLIKTAKYVITDSFHACVFSILYHTEFVVLDRYVSIKGLDMKSRIVTLLGELDLDGNYCRGVEEIAGVYEKQHTNWETVDYLLSKKREYSLEYLRKALKG